MKDSKCQNKPNPGKMEWRNLPCCLFGSICRVAMAALRGTPTQHLPERAKCGKDASINNPKSITVT
jgi:hypothetical protein